MGGFLIATGNPFDGLVLHGDANGLPFVDHDSAAEEATVFDQWWIVEIQPLPSFDGLKQALENEKDWEGE